MAKSSQHSSAPVDEPTGLCIPPHLQEKLEAFQQRLWSVKIAEGALAGLIGLGVTFFTVFAVDRIIDTPLWLRVSLLLLGFAVPAISIPLRWRRWVKNQRSLEQVARLLKQRFPRLGDELLGIVELSRSHRGESSRVLIEAAMAQVDERIKDRDFDNAVPASRYGLWLGSSLAVLGLSALLLLFVFDATRSSLARWIAPFKGVERYTFARIDPLPEELIVPYAENFDLTPKLSATSEWKPESASVRLPGKTKLSSLRSEDRFSFDVPPQKESHSLGLRVGDDYQKIKLTPLPRPELTGLTATLQLPDYLLYREDMVVPIRGGLLSVVAGTTATITGSTSRKLASANSTWEGARIEGSSFSTSPLTVEEAVEQTITWEDINGLTSKDPLTIKLSPTSDRKPDIFARQLTKERIVLADEVISFDLSASDDFGIRSVGLEWHGQIQNDGTHATKGEKPVAAGAPEKREIETLATFSASREGIAPQTVQIRAFAEDYLPDRERSYSPTFTVHILNPAQHAEWITREFGKWFRSAREVYEKEKQLYESNESLNQLSDGELDSPENRRKLAEQASAETANAKKLEALTRAGRSLVKQAAKNDEFNADRLESWSEKMQTLDGIAHERMPEVSDSLRQSSEAPGSPGGGAAKSEDPSGNGDESAPGLPGATSELEAAEKGEPKSPQNSPARKKLKEAVEDQSALLEEFARVADELQQILSSLEASTFVKRLKAAAREQTELVEKMDQTLRAGFGLPRHRIEQTLRDVGAKAATSVEEQSTRIYAIQTDLEAYYQRKQDVIYKKVLDQMKETSAVARIKEIGHHSEGNLSGLSISSAEYWADTLDRWAEELVEAANEGASNEGETKEGLPPEIVLKIMKSLQDQMYLRDETREMESVRPALTEETYESKIIPLELSQQDLRERVDLVQDDIRQLPDGDQLFGAELQLLSLVSDTMRQARGVLARPSTGPEAIAAQTEAIELLLQSKRQQNSGGGGGGNSPGGGAEAGGSGSSALSDISLPEGERRRSDATEREVEQSTGKAGRTLPEEFRRGLDTYFNTIESN
ncbi:MAG: hypothetical protein P1U68_05235 [Verrucomicrobiales bacterium]|nr:hypothetical protein [Verrucomicrobiales bacterium]